MSDSRKKIRCHLNILLYALRPSSCKQIRQQQDTAEELHFLNVPFFWCVKE